MGSPLFSALDWVVLTILVAALIRGLFQGLIRELFSIAALGSACLAARYLTSPVADWLVESTRGEIGAAAAPWLSGTAIALGALTVVILVGRVLRRGAHAAGLGWADRLGGGALGAAEGALIAGLLLVGTGWIVGHSHPILAESRAAITFQGLQAVVQEQAEELPSVASPPG